MTLLHGIWTPEGALHMWGERPLTTATLPRPRGRRPAAGTPRRHPFGASRIDLVHTLGDLVAPTAYEDLPVDEVALVLPSTISSPLPSPTLPGASQIADTPDGLTAWRVDALRLEPADALDVLLSLPHGGGPRSAASLVWLGAAARFALDLVVRGRVLPGLVTTGQNHEARWAPVLAADDRLQAARLAEAMPPSARARSHPEPSHPDPPQPGAVLPDLVCRLVDAAVRHALNRAGGGGLPADASAGTTAGTTAVHAWLTALRGDDATVHAPFLELQRLGKQLDAWRDSGVLDTGPLRTCFRLAPPALDEGEVAADDGLDDTESASRVAPPWRLEFCLQATDDPSLVVEAAEVWQADRTLDFLERTFEQPQERLLADLGRATRLYPELEQSLGVAQPTALELDVTQVQWFLIDGMPLLEQAGFGVLVPTELRRPARLGVKLQARQQADEGKVTLASMLGAAAIAEYSWEIAVGDTILTEEELRELARLKSSLVQVRGAWVSLGAGEVERAVELLERQRTGPPSSAPVSDVVRLGLGLADNEFGLPVTGADGTGALGALLRGDAAQQITAMPTPEGFKGTLRPYQQRGLAWLAFLGRAGLGACLADDMGLGKTPQLLALLVAERDGITRRSGQWPSPTLLVCPTSVVGNWQAEATKFAPGLRVMVHHGPLRLQDQAFAQAAGDADLVLTTYSLGLRDHATLAAVAWGRVALDEAQHIKNAAARQSRAIRSLPAGQRVALTGTPVENRLSELWSILEFCNPGMLGSAKDFRQRYATPIERHGDDEAAAALQRVSQPFVLRRLKTDRTIVDDLPDKLEMTERCSLTREQASLYQATVDDMLARIEQTAEDGMQRSAIQRKGLVLKTMLRLKQVCDHPALLLGDGSALAGRSGKLQRLEEILDEVLDAGQKALVFTQFAEMGGLLAGHLRARLDRDVAFLHGGTPKQSRDAMVGAFQSFAGPPVFVLSLKAGGVGLNLTAANHVVHFDRWWNPAVEDQATDRAFRIGQRRDVLVRKLLCAGTLEERIDDMLESKRALAERVVGSGESWLTELSVEELRDVISLSTSVGGGG